MINQEVLQIGVALDIVSNESNTDIKKEILEKEMNKRELESQKSTVKTVSLVDFKCDSNNRKVRSHKSIGKDTRHNQRK